MERQIKPLPKKPWTELTQEGQQVIRKSWKHHLPEVFDVFCIGNLRIDVFTKIPGNLYVSGNADIGEVNVGGDIIVDGDAYIDGMDVGGNFIVEGNAFTGDVNVGGDFIVGGRAYTWDVNVGGLFDCNDVRSYGHCIYATDFVCRCYEEKEVCLMERQSESLFKKPWEELSQEEQETIRGSWKRHLPKVFDVFCIGDLQIDDLSIEFPGNLYVSGNADIGDVNVGGDIIVEGDAYIDDMDVGGNFIVEGNAFTGDVNVGGDFIVEGKVHTFDVDVDGDFIVHGNADTLNVDVGGLFDCYDVNAHTNSINAADFVYHCYEEKNA